jgi:hypothetical protein
MTKTKIKVFADFDPEKAVKKMNEDKMEFFATQIVHTKNGWHLFAYYKDEKGGEKQ